jgi:predicted negative regulator of RcsB-dependent stress response
MTRKIVLALVMAALTAALIIAGPDARADGEEGERRDREHAERERDGDRHEEAERGDREHAERERDGDRHEEAERGDREHAERERDRREEAERDKRRERDERRERERRRVVFVGPREVGRRDKARIQMDGRLNVVDAAYCRMAEIYCDRRRYKEAVAALEQVVKKSPDKRAVSLAHLNLARVYRHQLNNADQAVAEYKQVTGEFAHVAQGELAEIFAQDGRVDDAAKVFRNIAAEGKDPAQRVLALQRLADLMMENGRTEEALAALRKLVAAVSYDEAADISKQLRKQEDLRFQREREEHERARIRMLRAWRARRNARQRQRADRGRVRVRRDDGDEDDRARPERDDDDE